MLLAEPRKYQQTLHIHISLLLFSKGKVSWWLLSHQAAKITIPFLLFLLFCQHRVSFPRPSAVHCIEPMESLNRRHKGEAGNAQLSCQSQMKALLFLAAHGFLCQPELFPLCPEACLCIWDASLSSNALLQDLLLRCMCGTWMSPSVLFVGLFCFASSHLSVVWGAALGITKP